MGATESKLAFRKNVFMLYEQRNIPATDDAYFSKFFELPENAEDIFNLFSPKDIRKVRDTAPENLETLLHKICNRMFKFIDHDAVPTRDDIRAVLNCVRILTRIIPYVFEVDSQTNLIEKIFWTRISAADPEIDDRMGPRLLRAVVKLLFFRGLTLPDFVSEYPGVRYIIWEKGVGASTAPSASAVNIANRIEILRLLLVLLSGSMYSPTVEVLRRVDKWHIVAGTGLEKKAVLTLLCSLLNTSLNYDPVGWGLIPYNHVLFTDSQEQLVTLCLETLIVLLDIGGGVSLQKRPSIVIPNEVHGDDANGNTSIGDVKNSDSESMGNNEFRFYMAKLHRPEDFSYIMDGTSRLLKNPLDASNTYLPGSTKKVSVHSEMLMLFWKLIEINETFSIFAKESEKVLIVLAAILHFALENKGNPNEIGLVRTCCFLLHILSQDRSFAVQLNAPFEASAVGIATKALPIFAQGCWGDFLILSIHAIITTTTKTAVSSLHENFLISLTNVSPYIKSLTVVTVNKLMSLFMSYSNAGFMMSNATNHKMVFYILDVFNNMVQYQITGNTHLVYAIVRHKARFHELQDMTFDSAMGELTKLRELKAERIKKLEQAGVKDKPASAPPSAPVSRMNSETQMGAAPGSVTEQSASTSNREATSPVTATSSDTPTQLSDKAKGKLAAAAATEKPAFVPTIEWFNYWKAHLRLQVLLTLVDALGPPIEALCIEKGFNDDKKVIEYLQSGTLVGLLPMPHPLFTRKFNFSEPVRVWFMSYLWGSIFMKSANPTGGSEISKLCPSIWTGTRVQLFNVKLSV